MPKPVIPSRKRGLNAWDGRWGWRLRTSLRSSAFATPSSAVGVSAAWDQFIEPLHKSLAEHSSMLNVPDAVIQRSVLGDDAALLGAAKLALRV